MIRTSVRASSSKVGLHENLKVALSVSIKPKIPASSLSRWDVHNKVGVRALIGIIPGGQSRHGTPFDIKVAVMRFWIRVCNIDNN